MYFGRERREVDCAVVQLRKAGRQLVSCNCAMHIKKLDGGKNFIVVKFKGISLRILTTQCTEIGGSNCAF